MRSLECGSIYEYTTTTTTTTTTAPHALALGIWHAPMAAE